MATIPAGEREFTKLLGQGLGYGIVVGIGFAFAALMILLTHLQKRFTNANPHSAAEFASAGRSVKPGLIAAGVVSAWTWSATLLQSSTATYQLGLSAAWWYAVGGTVQVAMFAMVAAKVKQNANGATTFLQIVKARYGTATHLLFTFYALVCFHVVSGSLVLGCSATVNALTGKLWQRLNGLGATRLLTRPPPVPQASPSSRPCSSSQSALPSTSLQVDFVLLSSLTSSTRSSSSG